jgi:hypothetical protein
LEVAEVEKTLAITVPPASKNPLMALSQLMFNDFERWRMSGRLRRRWKKMLRAGSFSFRVDRQRRRISEKKALAEAVQLASREMALDQQTRMLDATYQLFQYWHVAHRPFAITAAFAVIIHVGVVIYLGQTWVH